MSKIADEIGRLKRQVAYWKRRAKNAEKPKLTDSVFVPSRRTASQDARAWRKIAKNCPPEKRFMLPEYLR